MGYPVPDMRKVSYRDYLLSPLDPCMIYQSYKRGLKDRVYSRGKEYRVGIYWVTMDIVRLNWTTMDIVGDIIGAILGYYRFGMLH